MSDETHPTTHLEDRPAHHESGPSALALQELCPSYTKAESEETDHRDAHHQDNAADEGTALHLILETGVIPDGFTYTPEHQQLVANTLRTKEGLVEGADEEHREVMLEIGRNDDGTSLIYGTTDVVALFHEEKHAVIIDYKTGLLPVDSADKNIQGWAYALGAFERWEWLKTITMAFLIPRQTEVPQTHTFTRRDIPLIRTRIKTVIKRRKEGIITPHPSACEHCSLAPHCQPLLEQLWPLSQKWADEVDLFKDAYKIDASALEILIKRDPTHVGTVLRTLDVMSKFRTEVRDYVKDQILHGTEIPGYDVHAKRRPTKNDFARDRDVLAVLMSEFNVDLVELLLRMAPLRRTVCESAVRDSAPKGEKDRAVNAFRARIQELGLWYDPAGHPDGLTYILRAKKAHQYTGVGLPGRRFSDPKKALPAQQQTLSSGDVPDANKNTKKSTKK